MYFLLKIVNVAIGIVPSNLMVTTLQVFSRVMVVCGVVMATPTGKVSPGLPLALLGKTIELILNLTKKILIILSFNF